MIRASIDLGTNTCLLLVAEMSPEGKINRILGDHSTIVRLGQGVDQARKLRDEAMERTMVCLRRYAQLIKSSGGQPEAAVCVATASARDATNGAEFFAHVQGETGLRFRVLSGQDEAKYTFLGALLPGMRPESCAVIDIGGGSTEFIAKKDGKSLNLGSVRFTERFFVHDPVSDSEFWACQAQIDAMLEELRAWRKGIDPSTALVAVAGTATTLAAWHRGLKEFDAQAIDAVTLSRGDVHRMVEELKWRTVDERIELVGIDPQRADVILAGALILWRAMEVLEFSTARISTRGLRFGVLLAP